MASHGIASRAQAAWTLLIQCDDLTAPHVILAIAAATRFLPHNVRVQRDHLLRMRDQHVPETGTWATDRLAEVARPVATVHTGLAATDVPRRPSAEAVRLHEAEEHLASKAEEMAARQDAAEKAFREYEVALAARNRARGEARGLLEANAQASGGSRGHTNLR